MALPGHGRAAFAPWAFYVPVFVPAGTAVGMVAFALSGIVLVEGEVDARRTDHSQRLFFGRSAPAAPSAGQPWYLQRTQARLDPEEDIRRGPDLVGLHRFRTGFQTVGQNYRLWTRDQARPFDEPDVYPVTSSLYRTFNAPVTATPGAPWYLWVPPEPRLEPEEDAKRVDQLLLHRFRTVFQTVGQSYRMWPPQPKGDQPIEDERRVDQTRLHLFRTGFQTVGQPFLTWPGAQKRVEDEAYSPTRPADLTPFRQPAPAVTVVGAPWYLWPVPEVRLEPEDDPRRVDQTTLHRFRTAYQTVGQSWQYWVKPQIRLDVELYDIPAPRYPYRQFAVQVSPGQPWWAWPVAVGSQEVEPLPRYTDGAAALYPFRPHQAVTPPVVSYRIFIINE